MNQIKRKSAFDADKTQVGAPPASLESDLAAMRRQLAAEQEDEGETDGKTVVMGVGGRTSQLDDAFSEKTIIGRPEDLRGMEMPARKPIQTKTQAVATPPPTMSTPPPTMSRQMAPPPVAMEEEEEPVPPPPPKIHRARKLDDDNTDAELQISRRSRGGILRYALIGGFALAAVFATVLLSTHYRPNHIATDEDGDASEQPTGKAGRKAQKPQAEAERPPAMPEPVKQAAVAQPAAQVASGDDSMQKLSEQFTGDFAAVQRQVQSQGADR